MGTLANNEKTVDVTRIHVVCHNHRPTYDTIKEAFEHRRTKTHIQKQPALSLPQRDDC